MSKDSTSVDRHTSIAGTSNDVVKSDRKNQQEYELPFATDVRELVKDQNILGENERKKAEQNLGVSETMSFSSFHLSEQEMVGKLSAEYSSISLSSESNDNRNTNKRCTFVKCYCLFFRNIFNKAKVDCQSFM